MGSPVTATLAYGYDIGNVESTPINNAAWFDEDGPEYPVQLYDALYAAIPDAPAEDDTDRRRSAAVKHFGVEIAFCGADRFQGWVLIASGSEKEACNADTLVLNLHDMEHPPNEWFDRLTTAVEVLGIVPTQEHPRWLVFPSLG